MLEIVREHHRPRRKQCRGEHESEVGYATLVPTRSLDDRSCDESMRGEKRCRLDEGLCAAVAILLATFGDVPAESGKLPTRRPHGVEEGCENAVSSHFRGAGGVARTVDEFVMILVVSGDPTKERETIEDSEVVRVCRAE